MTSTSLHTRNGAKVGSYFHRQVFYCLKSGTTWSSLFQLEGTVRQGFMVTTLSQDLYAEAWSVSQAEQHVCNVASSAPGPLRKPSLVPSAAKVSQWVQLVLLSFNPPLSAALPLPFSVGPCAWHSHCLWQRLSTVYLPHIHIHNAAYPCTELDFHIQTMSRWGLVPLGGGGLEAQEVRPCARNQKGTWHLESSQPGDIINRVVKSCGSICDRLSYQVYIVNLRLAVSAETSAVFALSTISSATESSVGLRVCGAFSLSMSHSLWHAQLWRHSRKAAC